MKGVVFVDFYKKYIELCNKIGKSPSAVSVELGLSKSTVNRWKNGGSPTDATATKIASYFDVPVAYLKGWEEEQKKNDAQADIILKMRTDETFMSVVEKLYQLDKDKLESINQMLHTLFK